MLYRNKKNGKLYRKHLEVIDCTNARDGTPAVLYSLAEDVVPRFVREAAEFYSKFEPIEAPKTCGAI